MQNSLILLLIVGIGAGTVGYLLQPGENAQPEPVVQAPATVNAFPAAPQGSTTLAQLSEALQREVSARKALESELAQLKQQVVGLTKAETPSGEAQDEGDDNFDTKAHAAAMSGMGDDSTWFNEQALVDAGVDVSVAQQLKQQYETLEMKKLYLRDRASREGWLRSERFLEERQKLDSRSTTIRDQFGDKAYDAYLYAAGLPNRVEVQSVLGTAPAGTAGIQAGDRILSYDNQRIYTGQELRQATAQGQANETITVEVERGGNILQVYLPRGPMGIRMSFVSVAP
jgi:C-terminal processing protease CtpA/Prc